MPALRYAQEMEVSVLADWEAVDPVPISWYTIRIYIASIYRFSSSDCFVEKTETVLIEMQTWIYKTVSNCG